MNEWMNQWMNEWMNEWINEWIKEWMNEWIKSDKWFSFSGVRFEINEYSKDIFWEKNPQ